MTTVPDPTVQTPTDWTQEFDASPTSPPAAASVRGPSATHGSAVRPEDPKRNPVTYIALGIALLALLLSVVALTRDSGPDQIDVGGKRCIVQHIDGYDANSLFCQT
jgi:hypothetical protein